MRILRQRSEVLKAVATAVERRVPLLCPNAETPEEMEGILMGAQRHAEATHNAELAVGIGVTAGYPEHGQLRRLWGGMGAVDPLESYAVWDDWLSNYERVGWFPQVAVIPFLDHGWVPDAADRALLEDSEFQARMGMVMFDASALEFAENIRWTRAYVEQAGARVVVEACPDKIASQATLRAGGGSAQALSDPEQVAEFVAATGVDLIVPSLGTEHRGLPGEEIYYRAELARQIRDRVGPRMALHGTSSLGDKVGGIGADGICKVNYYTGLARAASGVVRESWLPGAADPLGIELAAGSHIFATRRESFAAGTLRMLTLLQGDSQKCM